MSIEAERGWRAGALFVRLLLALPIAAGLLGVILPAFGYLPAIGAREVGLDAFRALLALPGIGQSLVLSAWTALAATLISVALTALVLAAAHGTRTLAVVERLLAPLLAVPHAAAALGFVMLFAPSGLLLRLASPVATGLTVPPDIATVKDPYGLALVAALVLKEAPFLFLMALAALAQTRARERMALVRSLGYGRLAGFLMGVWPLIYRQIRLPVLAVLAFAASVVDVALILGPTRPPPLAVRIIDELSSPDLSAWLVGSAGAVAMAALVLALVLVWLGVERAAALALSAGAASGRRWRRDKAVRVLALALAGLIALGMGGGVAALLVQSVAGYWPFPEAWPAALNFTGWQRTADLVPLVRDTLCVAVGAAALSVPLAVVVLKGGVRPGPLIYAPLVVPQVAFLFGLAALAVAAGHRPGLATVTLGHAVFTLPYAVLALAGPWRALDPRYERLATSLGVPAWRRFVGVRLALLTGPLCLAAALAVAVSVALYLPTRLLGAGRVETLATEVVAAASGGDRRLVAVLALVQLVLPFLAFALARAVPRLAFRRRGAMLASAVR